MRKGREFFVVEVETLEGSRIIPSIFFKREGAEEKARAELKTEEVLSAHVYTLKSGKGDIVDTGD